MKKYLIGIGIVAVVALLYIGYRVAVSETLTNVTFTKEGERVCSSNNDCRFLEYTTDETFENTDEWVFFKWNSSDVHRVIQKDITCDRVLVAGWRVPFMSWYRNIITVEGCK